MKYFKYSIVPLISLLMILFYFSPWLTYSFFAWTAESAHTALGFYLIAFICTLWAWIPLIIFIIRTIVLKIKNDPNWKFSLINSISIFIFYIAIIIGISNDFMVTV